MFSIVRFKIPCARVDAWVENGNSTFERFYTLAQLNHRRSRDDFYLSEPMSTTRARFFECEQYLRSLVGDPPHMIEDLTGSYSLLRTRAPVAYDYGYVIEIGTIPGEFGVERLVAIPFESVEYQSGRYASGMYTPIMCTVYKRHTGPMTEHPDILRGILNG